jgi:hypothetical protein
VHDERALAVWRFLLRDDPDMREIACNDPSDEISGGIVFGLRCHRENDALAGKENLKI